MFFRSAVEKKALQFQPLPQFIFKNKSTARATLRPKKALIQSRNTVHGSRLIRTRARPFRCCRHPFKFSLVYVVLGAPLSPNRTFDQRFRLKAAVKAHNSLHKRFRALRSLFRRRTLRPRRSLRRAVSWRRGIVFRRKRLSLRRALRPRRRRIFRYRSARRRSKRAIKKSKKRANFVKKSIKRSQKQKKRAMLTKRRR